jgi:uncharacterized protein YecE (DUF72 family)
MNFGQLSPEELNQVDFTLPKDDPITLETLGSAKPFEPFRVNIGLTKWGSKTWVGNLYPPKLGDKKFLNEYVRHFNSIELNATFYELPSKETLANWREKALGNPDFRFCPKLPQCITHIRRLKNTEHLVTQFYENIMELGELLGPIFLQLSDNFTPKSFDNLKDFIIALPKDIPVFAELRHKDWFGDSEIRKEVFNLLIDNNIGSVIVDSPGRRDCMHMTLTNPNAFIRFVGTSDVRDYPRLDQWVERISKWRKQGLQSVSFFVHQHTEKKAPEFADYFTEKLNERLGLKLQRPQFYSQLK